MCCRPLFGSHIPGALRRGQQPPARATFAVHGSGEAADQAGGSRYTWSSGGGACGHYEAGYVGLSSPLTHTLGEDNFKRYNFLVVEVRGKVQICQGHTTREMPKKCRLGTLAYTHAVFPPCRPLFSTPQEQFGIACECKSQSRRD